MSEQTKMPERLSPEEDARARAVQKAHKHWGEYVDSDNEFLAYLKEAKPAYEYLLGLKTKKDTDSSTREADVEAIDRVLSMMPQSYVDENKWREDRIMKLVPGSTRQEDNRLRLEGAVAYGAQHKDEHLDQYIETARQDAEAAGHKIHLKETEG